MEIEMTKTEAVYAYELGLPVVNEDGEGRVVGYVILLKLDENLMVIAWDNGTFTGVPFDDVSLTRGEDAPLRSLQ
jgi:hypothetical protein